MFVLFYCHFLFCLNIVRNEIAFELPFDTHAQELSAGSGNTYLLYYYKKKNAQGVFFGKNVAINFDANYEWDVLVLTWGFCVCFRY